MLKQWKRIAAAAAVIACASLNPAQAQTKLTAGSSWVNQLGSILTIANIAPSGLMTGTYTSKVGCSAGTAQPMTGWYYGGSSGGAITFSVFWNGCNSVTSWSGQYNYQNGQFQTLWYLTAAAAPNWNGINAGTDTFVPTSSATKK